MECDVYKSLKKEDYYLYVEAGEGLSRVPEALLQQLAFAGRLVMPVGESPNEQELVVVQRNGDNQFNWQTMGPVRFVPLVGSAGWETESIDD